MKNLIIIISLLIPFSFNLYAQEQNDFLKQFTVAHQKQALTDPQLATDGQPKVAMLTMIAIAAIANQQKNYSSNPKYNCRTWHRKRYKYGKLTANRKTCIIWDIGRKLAFTNFQTNYKRTKAKK